MREILFRGKSKFHGGWEYGDLITSNGDFFIGNTVHNAQENWCQVYPESVGQFTGLLDRNGKKIFEGDLLKPFGAGIKFMQVKFEEGELIVYNNYGRWGSLSRFFQISKEFDLLVEIIGNIHDTTELLK